jgi:hypothetical protein
MKTFTKLLVAAILILSSTTQAQYCMLVGRVPYSNLQPGISNFKLKTINRTSLPVESMSKVLVVTTDTASLIAGHTYTVTITHTRDSVVFPTSRNNIRVWIDYNNNKSFNDAGEAVISTDFQPYGVFTGTFTIPATTTPGIIRLRATAKMSSDAGHIIPSSCDSPTVDPIGYHGEMEDYTLRILSPVSVPENSAATNDVSIFPNPTNNYFTVAFDEISNLPITIELHDMTGRVVGRLLDNEAQSSASYRFSLNDFVSTPGIYMVKVNSGGNTTYKKVVKAN